MRKLFSAFCNNLIYLKKDVVFYSDEKPHVVYNVRADKVDRAMRRGKIPKIIISENTENWPVVAVLLAQEPQHGKSCYYIYDHVVLSLLAHKLYPVFISYDDIYEQLEAANPAGIYLPGGAFGDFFSASTNADKVASWEDMRRAFAYRVMIDYAAHYKIPTLGICAGEQELAGFLGGKITFNFSDKHKGGVEHKVLISKNSLLHRIVGIGEIKVNSYHSDIVDKKSGGDFKITATSADGAIEAIEPNKPWSDFVLGVQWHPELDAYKDGKNPDWKIFDAFAKAVWKYNK